MKRLTLLYIGFVMCFATACTRQDFVEEGIEIPIDGYIYFNTDVASRGTLVTSLEKSEFGVYAYNYVKDGKTYWNSVKAMAKPNVFYNEQIKWNEAGYHYYDVKKAWAADSLYTFFGYYPYNSDSIVPSSNNHEGDPYLTYNLPTDGDVTKMVDVMTASLYDTDNSQSNQVGLNFKHRLVAMDVQARNFNEPYNGEDVYVKVTSLIMKFNNMKHKGARLMMDASLKKDSLFLSDTTKWKPQYTLVGGLNSVSVPPSGASTGDGEATRLTGIDTNQNTTLMFLPQDGESIDEDEKIYLNGWITFTYQFVKKDGTSLTIKVGNENISTVTQTLPFTTGKNMVAGRKYNFQMTFSRTIITIAVIESGEWTDKDVDIEFS